MPKYKQSDWSPLDQKVLSKFKDTLDKMAYREFGVDYDGDCPVRVHVLDRTRHEASHWRPVPYQHEAKTPTALDKVEEALLNNLEMALQDFSRFRAIQKRRRLSTTNKS